MDKSFDKFEIYVLRNILTVPEDLVNWLRLDHYAVSILCTVLFPRYSLSLTSEQEPVTL